MNAWLVIAIGAVSMMLIMLLLWMRQRVTHNAGIVDVAWSMGTGALGVYFAISADGWAMRRQILAALVVLWAVRLGRHVLRRVMNENEDGRYFALREKWGDRTQMFLFWFFQIQAIWAVLFALPVLLAARNPTAHLTFFDIAGILIWLTAFIGETIADSQLARFRVDPNNHGRVCRAGLWRYSRHPNYFFEWLHWWTYVAMALSGWWPWGWLTLFGPVLMLVFLMKITGIPPSEAQALRSRGEAYRAYQRTTSALFPWPPRADTNVSRLTT